MKFKIKHEEKAIQIVTLISFFMMFAVLGIPHYTVRGVAVILADAVTVISASLYFIEQAAGTVISVEDEYIKIRHIYKRKKIYIDEISDINIERYERRRKQGRYGSHYTEYRMRMTISTVSDGDVVLTDTATTVRGLTGFLFSRHDRLEDDEVHIYQAYQMICSCTGR